MSFDRWNLSALIISIGMVIGGFLAGNGIARVRAADRVVTVKGISEREARADLAIWPLRIVAADND
ncbi:MAG: SIMPL domain-containing protein, partial [Gemmatimonadaceae bacterium]|nr:SIMPL domain-containing protein [Gemmatimonadaceae bacterium]